MSSRIFLSLALLVSFLFLTAVQSPAAEGQLRVGTAKVDMTPENPAEPVHDPIFVRSLILELDGNRTAIIAADLPNFRSPTLIEMFKEKYYNIDLVLFSASHNHSAPRASRDSQLPGGNYQSLYEAKATEAVEKALENMFDAKISAGHRSFPQLGFNRLIIRADGRARESWVADEHYKSENPDRIPFGPVDPEVGVVKITDMEGKPRAIVVNYAMHSDIMCFNYEITADYPGVTTRIVEEKIDGVNCLFVNGGGGNVESLQISRRRSGPNDPIKGQYNVMERVGELLAIEAIKLANQLPAGPEKTSLQKTTGTLALSNRGGNRRNSDQPAPSMDVVLSTLLINGNIVIGVTPGELFSQLQLEYKAKMRLADTTPLFFGYTWMGGAHPGYVPDVRSAALGGYGAEGSRVEIGGGERIINKLIEQYYTLAGLLR